MTDYEQSLRCEESSEIDVRHVKYGSNRRHRRQALVDEPLANEIYKHTRDCAKQGQREIDGFIANSEEPVQTGKKHGEARGAKRGWEPADAETVARSQIDRDFVVVDRVVEFVPRRSIEVTECQRHGSANQK